MSWVRDDTDHLVTSLPLQNGRPPTDSPFLSQVVVFTGKLASLGRKEACALVERLGGEAADEVTARTTMLVVGSEGFGRTTSRVSREDTGDSVDKSNKLKKAEQVNSKSPGRVHILTEEDFCDLGGVPSPESLGRQLYSVREIRELYPNVREDHLRYLEKWQLIQSVTRTNADRYYGFPDLLVVKQASAELDEQAPFRVILRSLVAAREGQLTLDFQPGRGGHAHPAKVVALATRPDPTPAPDLGRVHPSPMDCQSALAARCFNEGTDLDEGDAGQQDRAVAAYRQALVLDPTLVPALVNLANLHYARDELVEAQALYERATTLEPDCFEAYFNLGNIHHDLGRFPDARECYHSAVRLNPEYADTHFYLAVTLEKLGQSQNAKPHWRAYQELAPNGEWVELAREFSE